MSDVLIPVLEEFKVRLERIENLLKEMKGNEQPKQKLAMDEIQDYLEKIHMA